MSLMTLIFYDMAMVLAKDSELGTHVVHTVGISTDGY